MPVYRLVSVNKNYQWGLWQITESLAELKSKLISSKDDSAYFSTISHEGRLVQTMASRLLVQQMLDQWNESYQGIAKDDRGKPYLPNLPYHVALSHTAGYAAAVLHRGLKVGIDIEFSKEKLKRVATKFLAEQELKNTGDDLYKLCICWCAKEALYKMFGHEIVSFKEQIKIDDFAPGNTGVVAAEVTIGNYKSKLKVTYFKIADLNVAYSSE